MVPKAASGPAPHHPPGPSVTEVLGELQRFPPWAQEPFVGGSSEVRWGGGELVLVTSCVPRQAVESFW